MSWNALRCLPWVLAALVALSVSASPSFGTMTTVVQAATPEAVRPELCDVRPLSETDLVAIAATATAESTTRIDLDAAGEPVDPQTVEAVTATVRTSVACANANDPLRAFALFTDRYLAARFGGDRRDDLGHLLAAVSRQTAPAADEDRLELVATDQVRMLNDGRIAARVTTMNAQTTFTDVVVLADVDGRWLIDEVIAIEPPFTATPVS